MQKRIDLDHPSILVATAFSVICFEPTAADTFKSSIRTGLFCFALLDAKQIILLGGSILFHLKILITVH